MLINTDYITARNLLLEKVTSAGIEHIPLSECGGRILAQDLIAAENIPPFDRSPYDGYAFMAADTENASADNPVTLRILGEIPAGAVPTSKVTVGTAVKILTGAPIPCGADAVVKFEDTEYTDETVTLFSPSRHGDNIVYTGEDVRQGDVLARAGTVIDPGTAGTLASQGITTPAVYKLPKVGIISTGSELVDAGEIPPQGKIRNSNRHTLEAALKKLGCQPVNLGMAGDSAEDICALIRKGLEECDAIVSTGGVSVGDYDLTPEAMELAGVEILFRGVDIKPGMACAYGVLGGKIMCGLSGNPASSITNFYAVALPALRKLAGYANPIPEEINVTLLDGFGKKSPTTRLLRGVLDLTGGTVGMRVPKEQGNVVLSSTIGCNVMAVVNAGSGKIEKGTILKGFLI